MFRDSNLNIIPILINYQWTHVHNFHLSLFDINISIELKDDQLTNTPIHSIIINKLLDNDKSSKSISDEYIELTKLSKHKKIINNRYSNCQVHTFIYSHLEKLNFDPRNNILLEIHKLSKL